MQQQPKNRNKDLNFESRRLKKLPYFFQTIKFFKENMLNMKLTALTKK